jgi:hypothetical protein
MADTQYLSDDEFNSLGAPVEGAPPAEAQPQAMSEEEFTSAKPPEAEVPTQEPKTGQNLRGDIAAGLRGIRESIPFARDVGAGAETLRKNIMGDGTTFAEEKKRQEARDAALAEEHPWSYGAGEVAGAVAPALLTGGESLLASGEGKVASKLGSLLGSEAEGKLAAGLGSGLVGGGVQGALHGLGTGTDLEERLGHAGEETLMGAGAGAVGAGLGHLASRGIRKIGEKLGRVEPIPAAQTSAQLMEEAKQAYKLSNAPNVKIGAEHINDLRTDIMNELKSLNYNKKDNRKIQTIMNRLKDVDAPITLSELDEIRKSTKYAAGDWANPHNQTLGLTVRDKIDDFIDTLSHEKTVGGVSPVETANSLTEARQFYKQSKKLDLIEEAMERAKNRSSTSGSGGNYDNALRQEIRKLYEKGSKYKKYWSPDEIKAMEQTMKGGIIGNIARPLGKLDPFHHGLIGAIELPHLLMHPQTGFIGPAVGMGAHKLSRHLTGKNAEQLRNIVASGGNKADVIKINPMESARARNIAVPATVAPFMSPNQNREERASGGKVDKRDYPAKRLTRMERALKRAQDALAEETKPIMQMPDDHVAHALEIAKDK